MKMRWQNKKVDKKLKSLLSFKPDEEAKPDKLNSICICINRRKLKVKPRVTISLKN